MATKRNKTEPEKSAQRERTKKNKIRKYTKLIKENPQDRHASVWETKLKNLQ